MTTLDPTLTIAAVAVFLTAMQLLITVYTFRFAKGQIDQAREQNRLTQQGQFLAALWNIYDQLDSKKMIEARRYIYQNKGMYQDLAGGNVEKFNRLSPKARETANLVSSSFSRIGYAVSYKLLGSELILQGYYIMIGKCWCILKSYIEIERNHRRNERYQKYFQELGLEVFDKYASEKEIQQMLDEAPVNIRPPQIIAE